MNLNVFTKLLIILGVNLLIDNRSIVAQFKVGFSVEK